MTNLKCRSTMAVLPAPAGAGPGDLAGIYHDGCRHASTYAWTLPGSTLVARTSETLRSLDEAYTATRRHGSDYAILRRLELGPQGLTDRLRFSNYGREARTFEAFLDLDCDFQDLMGLRLGKTMEPAFTATGPLAWRATSGDGLPLATTVSGNLAPVATPSLPGRGRRLGWRLALDPGATIDLQVSLDFQGPGTGSPTATSVLGDRATFFGRFADLLRVGPHQAVLGRAVEDLYGLLHEESGFLVIAAGLPNFDTAFGRDSFVVARLLLDRLPELAADILRLAALTQGRGDDPLRVEEEGKIFHELRRGELARRGLTPFSRYYGSVDSTPLFLELLGDCLSRPGLADLAVELEPAWRAALGWLRRGLAAGGGFLRFAADPARDGLKVQSWKDSKDSMSFADGSLATGPLAVGQVQAYAYGALGAGARLAECRGDLDLARACRTEAEELKARIRSQLWLPDQGRYALALDGQGRPLTPASSDPGHFLTYGLESQEEARALARGLLAEDSFSGWGIRTLASSAGAYNPLSYHNGSVWPHDNALIALGMEARGFHDLALHVAEALLEAVDLLDEHRAPELLAGCPRKDFPVPLPHPFTCSPQAWSAAAVLALGDLARSR